MQRLVGTVSRGIRGPIIMEGDNIVEIVVDAVLAAAGSGGYPIRDHDIIGITEAVVARAQGNYATVDQIAADIRNKFGDQTVGLTFPILSRNRFATCLKGIARGAKKIVLQFSLPADEVGNHLITLDQLDESGINPYRDVLTEERYRELFGNQTHEFTGIDYITTYRDIIEAEDCACEIIFCNHVQAILSYTKHVLYADIHSRERSKRILKKEGVQTLYGLEDILKESIEGSGYNEFYGLLGSNKATDNSVKLFPRECQAVVDGIQNRMRTLTERTVEVLIYGDGAFKDPQGKIWELADPVVSPAYTEGLSGQPNEIKLKYLADNEFASLKGAELQSAMKEYIRNKDSNELNAETRLGTTPRNLTDLVGSLCDLTSGSGDKGTPFVHIQGYFDNYAI